MIKSSPCCGIYWNKYSTHVLKIYVYYNGENELLKMWTEIN